MNINVNKNKTENAHKMTKMMIKTPQEIKAYQKRATNITDVTREHQKRRQRVKEEFRGVKQDMMAYMGWLDAHYAPTTALTKYRTLLALTRHKVTRQEEVIVKRWRQNAGQQGTKQAVPVTPNVLRKVLVGVPVVMKQTVLLLWVSASRHGDLARMSSCEKVSEDTLRMVWNTQKSDRYGQRRITKFVEWRSAAPKIFASYRNTLQSMKGNGCTVHSIRRGALTWLADQGYTNEQLMVLSGHTPSSDAQLGLRRYVCPSPVQPEGRLQLKMSKQLSAVVGGAAKHTGATRSLPYCGQK
eukprot:PhM_4_TR11631/c3_g2_i4/m.6238